MIRFGNRDVRLRTPPCKALKKVNEIDLDEEIKVITASELLDDVIVEFHPTRNNDWIKSMSKHFDYADDPYRITEKEHLGLKPIYDKQSDHIFSEKSNFIQIFFNHKCFTGPSLSKSKICSLPQYVGSGPLRLVLEEVVTKVISVAYVPPRILNDLSSETFEELLVARNLTRTAKVMFKAKYKKRVYREHIPICLNVDDVARYCECICEHIKCCYNLFGPNLYDGNDCPGHCRVLTKSNKFMKRATYYREKARMGELSNSESGGKKASSYTENSNSNNASSKTSRARYGGRGSSDSASSSASRSNNVDSRASSADNDAPATVQEVDLSAVAKIEVENKFKKGEEEEETIAVPTDTGVNGCLKDDYNPNGELDRNALDERLGSPDKMYCSRIQEENDYNEYNRQKSIEPSQMCDEFAYVGILGSHPDTWSIEDVLSQLEWVNLDRFKMHMKSEVRNAAIADSLESFWDLQLANPI